MPVEHSSAQRHRLVQAAQALAREQDGILSRGQVLHAGLTRWDVRRETRAGRWKRHGKHALAVHTGALDQRARWRVALLAVGGQAALDGVTALIAAGLKNYEEQAIHVSVPRGAHPRGRAGVRVHETRRRADNDVVGAGIPRVRPAVAAVRAALWATSDRQAALLVVMTVQQRLTTGTAIRQALSEVQRHRRRRFLEVIVRDVTDGAQALGELDFATLCRARGLPLPCRQLLRRGSKGRVYLDVYWAESALVVEIEGLHHGGGDTQVADALRQNALAIDGDLVLRIPVLGLRIAVEEFMAQVAAGLTGCRRRPEFCVLDHEAGRHEA